MTPKVSCVILESEPVGVMDQPVEDGVQPAALGQHLVPVIDGQLAGHEGGPAADAVLDEFEEIPPFAVAERR